MAYGILIALVLVLGLAGKKANRSSYIAIGIGALMVSLWELQQ